MRREKGPGDVARGKDVKEGKEGMGEIARQ